MSSSNKALTGLSDIPAIEKKIRNAEKKAIPDNISSEIKFNETLNSILGIMNPESRNDSEDAQTETLRSESNEHGSAIQPEINDLTADPVEEKLKNESDGIAVQNKHGIIDSTVDKSLFNPVNDTPSTKKRKKI